jgi:Rod binding domain-containing protein
MSMPVAPGGSSLHSLRLAQGANALSAPTTPERRVPVVDKSKVDPEVLKAAEGMEAMFLDYMMKVMRETVPKSDLSMDSPATQVYTSMMDSETAQIAARAGGIGLADQIIAYWEGARYHKPSGDQAVMKKAYPVEKKADTGGIHESRPNTQRPDSER